MTQFGVHDFEIPHEYAQPVRDMVIIRIPLPPKKVGSIHMPDMARDIMQHNVMAGRVVAMGPMAFTYKDGEGLKRHDVKVGDWVVIRPFAGTLMQGGRLETLGGYRYVSSFQDVISTLPADKMPKAEELLWTDESDRTAPPQDAASPAPDPFASGVRERVVYKP